jgi:hypothetical protein
MASEKQVEAARRNVKSAQAGARQKRSIANLPASTRSALGRQGAAVARRKRSGGLRPRRARNCTRRLSGATCPAGPRWAAMTWLVPSGIAEDARPPSRG